jgi:hypothetical protein
MSAALLAAAVKADGKLVTVMAIPAGAGDVSSEVLYTSRTLELPPSQGDSQPTAVAPSPTEALAAPTRTEAVVAVVSTATPAATAAGALVPSPEAPGGTSTNGEFSPFLLALLPVGLLLLAVVGVASLRIIRSRPR